MRHAGFVLVGGKSSRMGRDKALLPWGLEAKSGLTLAQHVAQVVQQAAGSVNLIGDPARYAALGYPVHADQLRDCGPLAGVATALRVCAADWALIVGCDMPAISVDALRRLLAATGGTQRLCVVAVGPRGPEPLCAVYHISCLPTIEQAAAQGRFKMREAIAEIGAEPVVDISPACFANLNTPEDLEAFPPR